MAKYCLHCAAVNSDKEVVCTRCGTPLGKGDSPIVKPPKKKKKDDAEVFEVKFDTGSKLKYGILFLVLAVAVIFLVMKFSNRGIVGTWETEEYVSGDYRCRNEIKFNKDHTGFFTQEFLHVNEEKIYNLEWKEIDENRYMIIVEEKEEVIELGTNKFIIEGTFYSVDEKNLVYRRK